MLKHLGKEGLVVRLVLGNQFDIDSRAGLLYNVEQGVAHISIARKPDVNHPFSVEEVVVNDPQCLFCILSRHADEGVVVPFESGVGNRDARF